MSFYLCGAGFNLLGGPPPLLPGALWPRVWPAVLVCGVLVRRLPGCAVACFGWSFRLGSVVSCCAALCHQSLVELLERPDILSLHAVRRVGRERQLHLKVRALCGEVEKVFYVLVDTGAQVSLVKAGLLPPECLTDSRKPVRLKVANGQYMVGGTKEAAIGLQFVNHRELSRPDLGKEILLQGRFYEAEMDWDMIVGYDFMMESDSGVLPAQASITLYQDDQLSWPSSPEHHVECQWIHPERIQLGVAALGTGPTGPANQKYGVMPEVAS